MREYDVNEYLKKKRKRQRLKDKILTALFVISAVVVLLSVVIIDSDLWFPTITCGIALLYLFTFTYANTPRGDDDVD